VIGRTTVGSDGTWQFTANLAEPGEYSLGVRSLAADGSVVAESEPVDVQLELPDITLPTLNLPSGPVQAGETELSGAGEPGSEVEIVAGGAVIGRTTVGSDGTWQFTANLAEPGEYSLGVRSLAADGSVAAESEPVDVQLELPEVAIPTLELPTAELQAGAVELTGTGEPGSDVEIVIDGQPVGVARADSSGRWFFTADLPAVGDYAVQVRALGPAGSVLGESGETALTIPAAEEVAPPTAAASTTGTDGQAYIVQADDWLSKLADKFYGDMFTYPVIVDATNAKAAGDSSFAVIYNPDLIEIGQKLWIPARSDGETN